MTHIKTDSEFTRIMERIFIATGLRTQADLANYLGIRQSSISDARRRGKIPSNWLITLMRVKNIFPEWILTGTGPCFVPSEHPETRQEFTERQVEEETLRKLSSRTLADELVRRITVRAISL